MAGGKRAGKTVLTVFFEQFQDNLFYFWFAFPMVLMRVSFIYKQ
jgi:hypothetical protein